MLSLLLACTFVQPEPPPVRLEPDADALARIDRTRSRHQATDAGAEYWRAVDAHGGMLRWERVAPLTPKVDGRAISPDDPLYALVAAPFAQLDATLDPTDDPTTIQAGPLRLHLDDQRRLVALARDGVRWQVDCTPFERLCLITRLDGSDGSRIDVRWAR